MRNVRRCGNGRGRFFSRHLRRLAVRLHGRGGGNAVLRTIFFAELGSFHAHGAIEIPISIFVFPIASAAAAFVPARVCGNALAVPVAISRRFIFQKITQLGIDVVIGKSVVVVIAFGGGQFRFFRSVVRTAIRGRGNRFFLRRKIFRGRKFHGLKRTNFRLGGNGNARRFARCLRTQNHLRKRVIFAKPENGFHGIGDDVGVNAALRRSREARGGIGRALVVLKKNVASLYAGVAKLRKKRSRKRASGAVCSGIERATGGRSRARRNDDDVSARCDERRQHHAHSAQRRNDLRVERERNFLRRNRLERIVRNILPGEHDADHVIFLFGNRFNGGNNGFRRRKIARNGNKFVCAEPVFGNFSRERVNANAESAEAPSDAQSRLSGSSGDDDGVHNKN